MKKRLIDDLEKIFSYYKSICESCDYDCMKGRYVRLYKL